MGFSVTDKARSLSTADRAARRVLPSISLTDSISSRNLSSISLYVCFDADLSGRFDSDAEDAALSDTAEPVDYEILRHLFAEGGGDNATIEEVETDNDRS